jgi:hypothetical protein
MIANNVIKLPEPASAPRGWHGMRARPQRRYSAADWKAWSELGDEARLVEVIRGSPAWLNDLREGTWVASINGVAFEEFERSSAAVGDVVEVRAFADGLGSFTRRLVLVEQPIKGSVGRKTPSRTAPAWTHERPVLPGKQVFKDTRAKYLEYAAQHPHVRRHSWLLARLLKMHWHRGIIPRHATIAKTAGVSISTVRLAQACCCHFGFLRVLSGKRVHRNNTYEVCWPAGREMSQP